MKDKLEDKLRSLITSITSDSRWNLEDELMIQVLGFTIYGYAFALGMLALFLDVEEINNAVIGNLVKLGVGAKYAQGLVEAAYSSFADENDDSVYSQLVNIGHSQFSSESLESLTESIFSNTEALRDA